jgi:hypothetical protein
MARKRGRPLPKRPRNVVDKLLARAVKNYELSPKRLGERAVHCYVSDRWLAFPEGSGRGGAGEELMRVEVMTLNSDEDPKRSCELILDRAQLEKALAMVERPKP